MKKRRTQIGELCSIKSGFAFKSNSFNTDGKGIPLIRIRDVKPAFSSTFYEGDYQEEFLISISPYLYSSRINKFFSTDISNWWDLYWV